MHSALSHIPGRSWALARGGATAGALAIWLAACGGADDPARQIERLRGRYEVKLTGWVVEPAVPAASLASVEVAAPAAEAAADGGLAAAAEAEGVPVAEAEADGGLMAAPPAVNDVHLDFEVWHDSAEKLNGLTVEVTQADGMGQEKAHYRVWLDTVALEPRTTGSRTYTLKEVPHLAGDVFTAALRRRVPRAEWSLYKEFPPQR